MAPPQVFFYIHIRRREFAIARSLGTKRIETVIMVFVEICLMFLVGAAIGTILILFVQETATQYVMAAALFFAMNVGAITACLMATGKSGNPITTGGLSSMSVLSVQSVSYSYKTKYQTVQAVKDVSCDLSAGTLYALVGKSGSGKTTLLSLLAGLDTPQSGDIMVNGQSLREIDVDIYRRKQASVIYQSYNLFPLMTVCENVMYPLKLLRHSDADAKKEAQIALEKVGLGESYWKRLPAMLSGGEQQRVAIARTLAVHAQIVLADEPTGNLDTENSSQIIQLLSKLAHEETCCVVVVTHDLEVAKAADVVFRMDSGRIKEDAV